MTAIKVMHTHCIHWITLILITVIVHTKANRYNISNTDLQYCKEYDATEENYSELFPIDSLKLAKNASGDSSENVIYLRLYLLKSQNAEDARILLTPMNQNSAYEIVFGSQGNINIIKHMMIQNAKATKILESIDYEIMIFSTDITPITLCITKLGNISVAITGQLPFISAHDSDLLHVKFIGFSSKAKWFYDCESSSALTAAATAAPTDEDDKLEPTNQNLERLQNDLFEQYDASIAPNDLNSFTIELTQSNFFPTKSLMTSHGRFRAEYVDKRLIWDPSEYGDTYQFVLKNTSNEQIWTPKIRVVNEMDGELTILPLMYTVTVAADGQLFAESNDSLISTLCLRNKWNWPFETVNCNINMQLDEVTVNRLVPLRYDFLDQHKTAIDGNSNNWRVTNAKVSSKLKYSHTSSSDDNDASSSKNSTILEMNIVVEENNSLVHQFFSVPIVGNCISIIFTALSFRQKQSTAMILNICSLIVLFIMLLMFSWHGPTNYTSTVVICYTHTLFLAWCIILAAAIRCIGKERKFYI